MTSARLASCRRQRRECWLVPHRHEVRAAAALIARPSRSRRRHNGPSATRCGRGKVAAVDGRKERCFEELEALRRETGWEGSRNPLGSCTGNACDQVEPAPWGSPTIVSRPSRAVAASSPRKPPRASDRKPPSSPGRSTGSPSTQVATRVQRRKRMQRTPAAGSFEGQPSESLMVVNSPIARAPMMIRHEFREIA